MRSLVCLTASLILCAAQPGIAKPAHANAGFQLAGTSWIFTDKDKTKVRESVDADGNYIAETAAGKHLDHGAAVMKGRKVCFTSAMTKDGETCWTTKPVKVGQSMNTVSDKGEKLTVKRVAYAPLKMHK